MKLTMDMSAMSGLQAGIRQMSARRLNAALATALTRTAVEMRQAVEVEMSTKLDRPTPYTMRSLFVRPARADRLDAEMYVKDDRATSSGGTSPDKYLLPQSIGGGRHIKRFEQALQYARVMPKGWQAVPAKGAQLDAYGNMTRGQITQILSQVAVEQVAGYDRAMSKDPRKRIAALRKAGGLFFSVPVGQRRPPGIYQREFMGNNLTPVLIFVRSTAYKPRFDFDGVARKTAEARLLPNVERAASEQLARMSTAGTQQSFGGF